MKLKYWLKYLIYIAIICVLIFLREYTEKLYTASYYRFEKPEMPCYAIIGLLLGVCIGLFLGLENLIREFGKEGIWKINLPKLILFGIPSVYFSLTNLLIISNSQFIHKIIVHPLIDLLEAGPGRVAIFQVILGYVIITSFYKYGEKSCVDS